MRTPADLGIEASIKDSQNDVEFIEMTLSNDESSTDEELVVFFMKELNMSLETARHYVSRRSDFLRK